MAAVQGLTTGAKLGTREAARRLSMSSGQVTQIYRRALAKVGTVPAELF